MQAKTRLQLLLRLLLAGLTTLGAGLALAQSSDRVEGLRDNTPRWHALTEARLVLAPGQVIERGTILIRDGKVLAAGADLAVPTGARIWKLPGRTVYPGFIDMASELGLPQALRSPPRQALAQSQLQPEAGAHSRNAMVRPELSVASRIEPKADELKAARELGFTAVLSAPGRGVFRGQSALLSTGEGQGVKQALLATNVAQHLAHDFARGRNASYPNSLMGSIALARQTWWDARWYAQASGGGERRETNLSLQALAPALAGRQLVIHQAEDEQDYLRIARVRDEFGLKLLLQGNGHEYRRTAQLKDLAMPLIVPLSYPAAPEVENPDTAQDLALHQLQHWEMAPSNLSLLAEAGLQFAVTAHGIPDARREFWPRLRQAVRRGLKPEVALASLTTVPARLMGQSQRLGQIANGQLAHLVVARGDLFSEDDAEIELIFVDGQAHPTEAWQRADARGRWRLNAGGKAVALQISGSAPRPRVMADEKACVSQMRADQLHLRWPCGASDSPWLALRVEAKQLSGELAAADGALLRFNAEREAGAAYVASAAAESKPESRPPLDALQRYPAGAFGISPPAQEALLLVRGATLWTSAAAGRLENTDLLLREGRIAAIGRQLPVPAGARVIEAAGKHVTPGLIDAHSHTAIARGVNEASSSITAEVRVGDVLDATDINIYRELAGGLTAANLLHGSANTIGGQSQVIKLRWGQDAEGLKFKDAPPGIKFALGENVKQSNWGEGNNTRYPQTRMGVEQMLRDAFQAARDYQLRWEAWQRAPKTTPAPRRDLQLDTLVELLQKKRHIHIHAYRADEILMFTRISREFGLSVAAFQHVLEGYKVATEIASIGAGSSTFSDWWAFKMEVMDAIPYNGALMHSVGVLTSFNSDSNELARRLNTEAAKAVRWGGLSETEALKFVTLNAARQLGIEQRVGSLEIGKDADFVIWNGHPLATSSKAEQTWIEGRRYFDREQDLQLRELLRQERARLLAKALPARMAALAGTPAARPAADASQPLALALAQLRLQQWLHEQARYAESYGNAEWHECTQETQQ